MAVPNEMSTVLGADINNHFAYLVMAIKEHYELLAATWKAEYGEAFDAERDAWNEMQSKKDKLEKEAKEREIEKARYGFFGLLKIYSREIAEYRVRMADVSDWARRLNRWGSLRSTLPPCPEKPDWFAQAYRIVLAAETFPDAEYQLSTQLVAAVVRAYEEIPA